MRCTRNRRKITFSSTGADEALGLISVSARRGDSTKEHENGREKTRPDNNIKKYRGK
jgi:hypothetical protein